MTPLCEIAVKYRTDKCPQIKHNYTPFYYEMFAQRRNDIKKVVEMGIGDLDTMPQVGNYTVGASLRMWREFFPNAQIFGFDISQGSMFLADRITTRLCDERDYSQLDELLTITGKDVDLFIDDGSHLLSDQLRLCKYVLPKLQHKAVYIIEDVFHPPRVIRGLPEFLCTAPDLSGNRSYRDNLVVVTRK